MNKGFNIAAFIVGRQYNGCSEELLAIDVSV